MEPGTDIKGWPTGNYSFTKEEARDLGFLSEKDFKRLNVTALFTSAEAMMDLAVRYTFSNAVRTSEITNEEIQSWNEWDDKISKMDLDYIRGRMVIEGKTNWSAEEYILQDGFF